MVTRPRKANAPEKPLDNKGIPSGTPEKFNSPEALRGLASRCCAAIAQDQNAPAAARVQAANLLISLAEIMEGPKGPRRGALGGDASLDEISAELDRLRGGPPDAMPV